MASHGHMGMESRQYWEGRNRVAENFLSWKRGHRQVAPAVASSGTQILDKITNSLNCVWGRLHLGHNQCAALSLDPAHHTNRLFATQAGRLIRDHDARQG